MCERNFASHGHDDVCKQRNGRKSGDEIKQRLGSGSEFRGGVFLQTIWSIS